MVSIDRGRIPRVVVLAFPLVVVLAGGGSALAFEWSQDNSCVLLNECNSDALNQPLDCMLPGNFPWCSCARTVLSNPVRGEASGVEMGVIWITGNEQPGIGNHRVEVESGTLDVSGLQAGDVIGTMLVNELIPEGAGFPPGATLTVRGEARVTANDGTQVDFDVVVVETNPYTLLILRYDPVSADQSDGLLYRGRAVSGGAGLGFTLEYRYEGLPGKYPALRPGDVVAPGFNVRFALSFFTAGTAAASAYVVPATGTSVQALGTIRKFTESGGQVASPDEILPLGEDDLCRVVADSEPCKTFDDLMPISAPGANKAPRADVCVTDPITLGVLDVVYIECGEGRAILRGAGSTDGDGGAQGLTYLWEVTSGPEGGAIIPPEFATFQDVEITFLEPGRYDIRLTIDDGQAENHFDDQTVTIDADAGFVPDNLPPEIVSFSVDPDPPAVTLSGGSAQVRFDARATTGADGCIQSAVYAWESVSGPAPVTFDRPADDDTTATFIAAGEYVIRFTVDDGAPQDNLAVRETTVTVSSGGNTFQRCDANGDGNHDLSDAVYSLNHLFLGGADAPCREGMNCNAEGEVDISDPIFGLNYLFLGGAAPRLPYPSCDLAEEGCAVSTPCE